MTTKREPLGIIITPKMDGDFFNLTGGIIRWNEAGKVRNPSDYDTINGFPLLNNLQITSQGTNKDRDRVYGFEVRYRDVYAIDLSLAEKMVKTLRKVNAGMDKLTAKRGYVGPGNFGEYVGRVAEVIGATKILYVQDRPRRSSWLMHDDVDYTVLNLGDGVNHVNHVVRMWQQRTEVV
jgi:hypothetical protein